MKIGDQVTRVTNTPSVTVNGEAVEELPVQLCDCPVFHWGELAGREHRGMIRQSIVLHENPATGRTEATAMFRGRLTRFILRQPARF